MHGSPPPQHCILGSVSTFKCDDLFALKHSCVGPLHHTTIFWVVSMFKCDDLSALTHLCMAPQPHHYILGSVSTFKSDDLFTFKHLCIVPLHHTTLSLVQFYHSSLMIFLHLNIYESPPSYLKSVHQ